MYTTNLVGGAVQKEILSSQYKKIEMTLARAHNRDTVPSRSDQPCSTSMHDRASKARGKRTIECTLLNVNNLNLSCHNCYNCCQTSNVWRRNMSRSRKSRPRGSRKQQIKITFITRVRTFNRFQIIIMRHRDSLSLLILSCLTSILVFSLLFVDNICLPEKQNSGLPSAVQLYSFF